MSNLRLNKLDVPAINEADATKQFSHGRYIVFPQHAIIILGQSKRSVPSGQSGRLSVRHQ